MDLKRYGDDVRFAYLRVARLRTALEDAKLLDILACHLEVPVRASELRSLPRGKKLEAIAKAIEYRRSADTSIWHGVPAPEVLAACVFQSAKGRYLSELFCNVKNEHALFAPVSAWVQSKGLHVFDEVQMSDCRVDVLGRRQKSLGERFFKDGLMGMALGGAAGASESIAVELKDELGEMQRGFYQMTTYSAYAHKVYLACTPFCAASLLDKHAAGVKVRRWDPERLNGALKQAGFGLLLVEGNEVYEHIEPRRRSPDARKLEEIDYALRDRKSAPPPA